MTDRSSVRTSCGNSRTIPKAPPQAATAASNCAVPFPRSPSARSALPRLFCVAAQSSGTRSRVLSFSAARYAVTASPSRAVPLSRSPNLSSALPIPAGGKIDLRFFRTGPSTRANQPRAKFSTAAGDYPPPPNPAERSRRRRWRRLRPHGGSPPGNAARAA